MDKIAPHRQVATLPGFRHLPSFLDHFRQRIMLEEVLALVDNAGWFKPTMPRSGRPMSVLMCNLGSFGWISDIGGYRYEATHPDTGKPWPLIPKTVLDLWRAVAMYAHAPECCLVNLYRDGAKMGLHQDRDEQEFEAPVVSVSLGDTARFRVGGTSRRGPTAALSLESGDVVVMGGEARLCFHGIDHVRQGSSDLVPGGGRVNLTLRRVTPPSLSPHARR